MAKQEYTKTVTVTLYDGTKKRIKKRGYSQKEVDDKIQKALWEYENGMLVLNSRSTVSAWAKEWLEVYAKPTMSRSDYEMYEAMLRLHILNEIGQINLADLLPSQIQRCVNRLSDMSASYINKAKIILTAMFKAAKANRLILDNPMEDILFPRGKSGKRRALTQEERELFLAALRQHPKKLLFGSMYAMGLRPGEARALMWSSYRDGMIHVESAIKKDSQAPGPPKTASGDRYIPVPVWFQEMLDSASKTSLYISPGANGSFISKEKTRCAWNSLKRIMYLELGVPTYRNQIIEEEAKKTSIYELTPYYLRHTYATILAENGVELKDAQYLLGHASIDVTADIYTHVTDAIMQRACTSIHRINFGDLERVPYLSRETPKNMAK